MVLWRSLGVITLLVVLTAPPAKAQMGRVPLTALASTAVGQVANSPIVFANQDGITTSFLAAPVVSATSSTSLSDNQQWLKIEFHYAVAPQKIPFLDSVEFKVWVEGRDLYAANAPGDQGVSVLLTGSVTYINLPKTSDGYGVFYLHPSTMTRYSTSRGYEDFDRKFNIHIMALVGGQEVDHYDKFKDQQGSDWYKGIPTLIPNLVYRQDQSPFVLTDVMRYPQMKLQTSGASQ
ncbi:MAG: hypothetical protein WDO13_07690 [Verrucomicrobiota bacterium]